MRRPSCRAKGHGFLNELGLDDRGQYILETLQGNGAYWLRVTLRLF
jgi:hypothetical protein